MKFEYKGCLVVVIPNILRSPRGVALRWNPAISWEQVVELIADLTEFKDEGCRKRALTLV